MDNNEINSIILKIYDEQKKTNKQIGKMQKQMKNMQDKIGGLGNKIGGLESKIGGLENKHDGLQGQVISLQEQVKEMQVSVNEIPEIKKEIRTLSGRVAVIEKEHGDKLQILLDVVSGNSEKNKQLEKRIEDDEKIINRHSDEIYYLKKEVQSG